MTEPLHHLLFPELKDRSWGYVNFNEEALAIEDDPKILDPEESGHWVEKLHKSRKIDYSYGGYFEDRAFLMRGHYQKPGETWHFGIDYTVPVGAPVYLPWDADLMFMTHDPDQHGGWGGKMIFRLRNNHFAIFAHLAKSDAGREDCRKGDFVGSIGDISCNGGWFPHLHLQIVAPHLDPNVVDGYGRLYDGVEKDFPRPE